MPCVVSSSTRNFFGAVSAAAAPVCDNVDFVVYFEWDRSDLTDQAARTIGAASDQAEACSVTRVTVEGHADRSGSATYNVGLSERRARVVREELIRRGVAASAISRISNRSWRCALPVRGSTPLLRVTSSTLGRLKYPVRM